MFPTKSQFAFHQEKKRKIDFQDGRYGGHFGFPIETILAFFFNLHDTPMLLMSLLAFRFRRISENKIFKMATIAAILESRSERFQLFYDLQVTDASDQVSSWMPYRNNFSYVCS